MFKFTLDPDPPLSKMWIRNPDPSLTKIVDPDPPKVKRILTPAGNFYPVHPYSLPYVKYKCTIYICCHKITRLPEITYLYQTKLTYFHDNYDIILKNLKHLRINNRIIMGNKLIN